MTQDSLAGRDGSIRIDKPADLGVIVAGGQVVKAGLSIIVVTPVAERIKLAYPIGW